MTTELTRAVQAAVVMLLLAIGTAVMGQPPRQGTITWTCPTCKPKKHIEVTEACHIERAIEPVFYWQSEPVNGWEVVHDLRIVCPKPKTVTLSGSTKQDYWRDHMTVGGPEHVYDGPSTADPHGSGNIIGGGLDPQKIVQQQPDGTGHACGAYPCPPKPEPVDVPAVKQKKVSTDYGKPLNAPCAIPFTSDYPVGDLPLCKYERTEWTCADKSRILLTSEDGKKWCHKVQTEVTP